MYIYTHMHHIEREREITEVEEIILCMALWHWVGLGSQGYKSQIAKAKAGSAGSACSGRHCYVNPSFCFPVSLLAIWFHDRLGIIDGWNSEQNPPSTRRVSPKGTLNTCS